MTAAVASSIRANQPPQGSLFVAYVGVLLFFLVYYTRPSEWVPGGAPFPFAKVAAFLAIAGFLVAVPLEGAKSIQPITSSPVLRGLILLFAYLLLTIPTATWPGGSFTLLTGKYWKGIVITLIACASVNSLQRLKALLYISTLSFGVLSVLEVRSFLMEEFGSHGRVFGVFIGTFGNPNELALHIVLLIPFCLTFVLSTRSVILRLFWATWLVAMVFAVLVTFSRAGFLALLASGLVVIWELGFKGRRPSLVLLSVLFAIVVAGWFLPTNYDTRLQSILNPDLDETGSTVARLALLRRSVSITVEHPVFGVGPGNFPAVSSGWQGTHNTFAQFSTEAGIPALLLFLWILRRAFLNTTRTIRLTEDAPAVQLLAKALRASLVALVVGALFYDAAYMFFTYFFIGYAVIISRIGERSLTASDRTDTRD